MFLFADTSSELAKLGPAGLVVVILALAGVVVYQNRKIDGLYKEKEALQDKRLSDVVDMRDKYQVLVGNFTQTFDLLLNKLKRGK